MSKYTVSGHVYVARAPDGRIKIGRSMKPAARMKTLSSQGPKRQKWVLVFFSTRFDDAHEVEKQAQRILALDAEHIGREQFVGATISMAISAVALAIRQVNGVELPLAGVVRHKEAAIRDRELRLLAARPELLPVVKEMAA